MSGNRRNKPAAGKKNEGVDERSINHNAGANSQTKASPSLNGSGSGSSSIPLPLPPTSSISSTIKSTGNYRTQLKSSPMMSTINSTGNDGHGSDGRPVQPPPTHSLFNALFDDSDGSDGSIVFSNRRKPPSPGSHEPGRDRERFPSFDSMASSGSLVRHAPQHSSTMPSAQAPKITPQNLAKVNPQMLPYDQRRKLMKLKQQQKQKQRDRSPTQGPPPDGRYVQYMMPPPELQAPNLYNLNGMPMVAPPSPQSYGYPMQPQQMPISMVPGAYAPSNNSARLSPYNRSSTPPRFDPNRPPPQATRQGGRSRQYPTPLQIPQTNNIQVQPPGAPNQLFPPSGVARLATGRVAGDRLIQSSSIDSSDQDFPVRSRNNRNPNQLHQLDNTSNSSNAQPPPPPPPPVPPHHVRAESTGSVSSLGSQGSIFGYHGCQDDDMAKTSVPQKENLGRGKSDFLQLLNPFSTKTRQPSPQEAASDFHRQNQDFLQQSTGRPTRAPSPQQRHHRVGSLDRPPATRGTHKRLYSIENDNWEESGRNHVGIDRVSSTEHSSDGNASPSSHISSSEETEDDGGLETGVANDEANERTSLLPPPGQGSSEHVENSRRSYKQVDSQRSSRRRRQQRSSKRNQSRHQESEMAVPGNQIAASSKLKEGSRRTSQKKHTKNKRRRRSRRNQAADDGSQSSNNSGRHSSSSSSYDYRQWSRRRVKMLEDERSRLIAQWKAEARAEGVASRRRTEEGQWHYRLGRYFDSELGEFIGRAAKFLSYLEQFISNLPLTVGAISISIVTLGVVWFKFVEELLDSCEPVQFHSSQCTFPEFPGCFYCDTTAPMYKVAVNFHFGCSAIAGVLALSFVLKMILATQVVLDEMSSPTTASPAGLICMTTVFVFAGRGFIGQILVSLASCVHLCLVIWFIYMALAYHIMPEPSWYPNSVGIGLSAVKTWLYYPMSGHFLMAISLSLNFFFFPISLIRVALNEKISAPVAYMQMSAPAISLYACTIMAQPSFEQEKPDINRFQRAHRLIYLPAMHFLFVLSVIGLVASVQALLYRWKDFRKREFSPAHAAFCFPTLLHANAIQAYRAAINSFSNVPAGSPWKIALDVYWVVILVVGTLVTIVVTAKFFYNLPGWTNIDVSDEIEPPAPYETTMTLQNIIATGESLVQAYISPAVLQANETGALVMVRRSGDDSRQKFVRTRRLAALGFEPIMSWTEMSVERELLLDFVVKHPPRRRNRTLSVPGIDFSYGPDFGVGNNGVYGVDMGSYEQMDASRAGAQTISYQGERPFF